MRKFRVWGVAQTTECRGEYVHVGVAVRGITNERLPFTPKRLTVLGRSCYNCILPRARPAPWGAHIHPGVIFHLARTESFRNSAKYYFVLRKRRGGGEKKGVVRGRNENVVRGNREKRRRRRKERRRYFFFLERVYGAAIFFTFKIWSVDGIFTIFISSRFPPLRSLLPCANRFAFLLN